MKCKPKWPNASQLLVCPCNLLQPSSFSLTKIILSYFKALTLISSSCAGLITIWLFYDLAIVDEYHSSKDLRSFFGNGEDRIQGTIDVPQSSDYLFGINSSHSYRSEIERIAKQTKISTEFDKELIASRFLCPMGLMYSNQIFYPLGSYRLVKGEVINFNVGLKGNQMESFQAKEFNENASIGLLIHPQVVGSKIVYSFISLSIFVIISAFGLKMWSPPKQNEKQNDTSQP